TREKMVVPVEGIGQYLRDLLDDIQQNLFNKAMAYRQANSCQANSWDEFKIAIGKGGFVMAHWDGTTQTEEAIKAETKATIRCIPLNNPLEDGVCVYSGKPSTQRVIFARAH
ncbi:MAG TPA: proline--tRNA ligase, partial [Chitinophagales bacterium]|nr:proline--tRNA ligase [Chitinophagales bacterium]